MIIYQTRKENKMIKYYYFGMQCPYNYENKLILEKVAKDRDIPVEFYDITGSDELAASIKLYSPSLIVFDNGLRWSGPITYDLIVRYLSGEDISRKPYVVNGSEIVNGSITELSSETIHDVSVLCCPRDQVGLEEKKSWLEDIMGKSDIFGIIHYSDNKCVGGAEYLPSLKVPYDIPKSEQYAFLTCLHTSDSKYDYKDHPLKALELHLKDLGYKRLYAVASKDVVFPNGPLDWFFERGYRDLGLLNYEENEHAYQHLIVKDL